MFLFFCGRYESVSVMDFKSSWRNGMAFLAIIHALRPDLIDMKSVKQRSNKDNLKEAFRIAEQELKIPKMLEPEGKEVSFFFRKSLVWSGFENSIHVWTEITALCFIPGKFKLFIKFHDIKNSYQLGKPQ